MNISELVAGKLPEIKKLLFNEEPVAEAFEDAKLVDGTIVRYEVLEVGANLSVIGEDGEVVEAPDGTHELESGVIVRTEGGVIVEVMEPEAAPEEVEEEAKEEKEEEMAAEETTEEVPAFDADKFREDILGAVSNLVKSEIDAAAFASAKKVDEVTEAVSLVTDIVEKMAATPKEAPTKKVANPFSKGTSSEDLVEKMRKALNK